MERKNKCCEPYGLFTIKQTFITNQSPAKLYVLAGFWRSIDISKTPTSNKQK